MENLIRNGMKKNNRRYPGIKGRRPDQKVFRKDVADSNLKGWQALSPDQQLVVLDRRLGKGVGATRQRARIIAQRARRDRKGS